MLGPIVFLFAIASALPATAQDVPPVLSCGGPISGTATHAALVRAFGARNVAPGKIALGEGETETGTVIFGSDPARRLEVLWHDVRKRIRPRSVTIRGGNRAPTSPASHRWSIATSSSLPSLSLGQSLSQVEASNGRPFELAGFEWDYSGTATNWRGGALSRLAGGCQLVVRFEPAHDLSSEVQDAVVGDQTFSSNDPKMRAARPVIYEMGLYWD